MTAIATGRLDRSGGADSVVFERDFRAPIADVWAAVTESDRLARWIGTWTGDPATGAVQFQMNAEGDDVPESRYEIRRCEPPRLLAVHAIDDSGTWKLTAELRETAGVTTLRLSQVIDDPSMVESTGPGWDFYLDRLVAAETGGDVSALVWDRDYWPALRDHYVAIVKELTAGGAPNLP
jgi:uncharacterized protein YndB with AHSA1/START domain